MARQNVALADNLADEWWRATSDAVTRIQMGDSLEAVVRDGIRRLAAAGLGTIDYRSGARTTIDAAVRRHAITQQNQCRNDMLIRDCRTYGVRLVFTSAHYGARPSHAEWQGKAFGLDGPCEVGGAEYPGLAEATGYGTVGGLCGANCVVEGTLVSGPEPSAAYRREYEGEIVAIRTGLGHDLAVTPNHPILTERGWVPAHEVKKGDRVFSNVLGDGEPSGVRPHEQHGETAVEDVFDALGDAFGVHPLLGSAADFHGDGTLDQQVDVVLVDARLMADRDAPRPEHLAEPSLLDASRFSGCRLRGGPPAEVFMAPLHAPDGLVGGPAEVLSLLGGHPAESGAHGVGSALGHDAVLLEPLADGHGTDSEELRYALLRHAPFVESDDLLVVELLPPPVGGKPKFPQLGDNEPVPASESLSQLADGRAFLVEPDEVVDVNMGLWSGHVYNLQTKSGWYFSDSIVTHNCRHRLSPYVPGLTRLPDTDFRAHEAKWRMTSDEYYEATQRQRAMEREIRATKRGIALGEERGLDMAGDRYRLGAQQKRLREHCDRLGLPRDYRREKAYAAADPRGGAVDIVRQPRALRAAPGTAPASGGITVGADELVPCLRRNSDGRIMQTTVREMGGADLRGYNTRSGWRVNWQGLAKDPDTHVFCVNVEGSDEIQGLVAMRRPTEAGAYPYGLWAVANPRSQGDRVGKESKEYSGIGGHLFAIMCEQSAEWGCEGIVTGMAANGDLLEYYEREFGAERTGGLGFFIGPEQARALMEKYNYERR